MTNEAPQAPDWRTEFLAACQHLPDAVAKTPEQIAEDSRLAEFRRVCDVRFIERIDRARLLCPDAFDRVSSWDGGFPGPCAHGLTGAGKSRSAWVSLGRLYVRRNRAFAWFPARRLIAEMERYEKSGSPDEFFRLYDHFRALFVDDLDKINWQFDSSKELLFAFVDWVYRKQKPCIVTTNQGRAWWAAKMGDAFARRLFDDAFQSVEFAAPATERRAA